MSERLEQIVHALRRPRHRHDGRGARQPHRRVVVRSAVVAREAERVVPRHDLQHLFAQRLVLERRAQLERSERRSPPILDRRRRGNAEPGLDQGLKKQEGVVFDRLRHEQRRGRGLLFEVGGIGQTGGDQGLDM